MSSCHAIVKQNDGAKRWSDLENKNRIIDNDAEHYLNNCQWLPERWTVILNKVSLDCPLPGYYNATHKHTHVAYQAD